MFSRLFFAAALALALVGSSQAVEGLKKGTPAIKSAGALAFGPEGVLFVADPVGATIFAIDTGDNKPAKLLSAKIDGIDGQIASILGTTADQILINDMKVNPASGTPYLSVTRGKGPDAAAVLFKVTGEGKAVEVPLKDIPFAQVSIGNPNAKRPNDSVTSMAFVKGNLVVSGLTSEEWAANLRSIPFPFTEANKGAGVQIYHGAHGKFETQAPIQTFAAYDFGGQTHLLASYVCTPLVKIPLDSVKPGEKVKGKTIAELGNRNRPLDIVIYSKDGKDYALIANTSRGVMKVNLAGTDTADEITSKISDTAGLPYETIKTLAGTTQLDKLSKDQAVVLRKTDKVSLETIPLP